MDENKIMNSEEITDATTEIVKSNSGKRFMIAAGVGVAVAVGAVVYKYAVKPMIAKARSKKEMEAKVVTVSQMGTVTK